MINQHVVADSQYSGIQIVRFIRPEYREEIYDKEPVSDSTLYREVHDSALAELKEGETLILNFGLTEWFPSRFYSLLLAIKGTVEERKAHLRLCCLTPVVQEAFDLFQGWQVFEVEESEREAIAEARK